MSKAKRNAEKVVTATWPPKGFDGQTHYADLLKALLPAMLILTAGAVLLVGMH
ncbi:hypothetical protein GCM10007989_11390 [Devosia pacifica]|uniref:Uncharacterized protein n=1 Tax=Devosia pacifica TaxID=1335967 RepID=A0A918VR43_9HYPH|nr:hypothetical protein [Devosia pacifica]GHA17886.1 hypothetical protein GCM10007989_11390 [Devosia pacifica]